MKKFFPKNAKSYTTRTNKNNKIIKKPLPKNTGKKCKSLKEEFDFIMKNSYKHMSAGQRKQIWNNIILDITQNRLHIDKLKTIIYKHINNF